MRDYVFWLLAATMLIMMGGCKTTVVLSANRYFEQEQTHTSAEIRMEKEW
tara:strand:- start:6 stop:155 length:150 start_codon:yes stop_codon:yes gene_type:complete